MKHESPTVIERDIKCPFCENPHALLISKDEGMKTGVGLPAYGLRSLLRFIYLYIIHIAVSGLRLLQISRKKNVATYIFCPACGNSVSANPPEEIKQEFEEPSLYRIKKNKVVTGLSQGIAEFTGIPVLWVRICNIVYAAMGIYFLIAICIPYKEDVETGVVNDRKFSKAKEGKWLFGLCKGIANYTDISVVWIRIWACLLGSMFIPAIAYIVLGVVLKIDDRKFSRAKEGKWLFGICKGIANYTDTSVVWIRILTCLFGLMFIPAIVYIVVGIVLKKKGA